MLIESVVHLQMDSFARRCHSWTYGWFDGNPTTLNPLSEKETARRMVSLAGGEAALEKQLNQVYTKLVKFKDGQTKWN